MIGKRLLDELAQIPLLKTKFQLVRAHTYQPCLPGMGLLASLEDGQEVEQFVAPNPHLNLSQALEIENERLKKELKTAREAVRKFAG